MNENCCLCKCFTELYFFYWLLVVSLVILIAVPFVFSRSWTSLAGVLKINAGRIKRFWRLHIVINSLLCWSVTLLVFIQTLHSLQLAGRYIGDFGNFFSGFAKSPRVLRSSWILNECNLYFKIVKYCILSEVCMIKTGPHSNVLPQMWCIKSIKGWLTRPQIC